MIRVRDLIIEAFACFHYETWKRINDREYYKIKSSLRKDWLGVQSHLRSLGSAIMIFCLSGILSAMIWEFSHVNTIYFRISIILTFVGVVFCLIMLLRFFFCHEKYLTEKYLEMSK